MSRPTRRVPLELRKVTKKICKVCGRPDNYHPRPGTLKLSETYEFPQCAGGVIRNPNWRGHRAPEPPVIVRDPKRVITQMFKLSLIGIATVSILAPAPPDLLTRALLGLMAAALAFLIYLMIYLEM